MNIAVDVALILVVDFDDDNDVTDGQNEIVHFDVDAREDEVHD